MESESLNQVNRGRHPTTDPHLGPHSAPTMNCVMIIFHSLRRKKTYVIGPGQSPADDDDDAAIIIITSPGLVLSRLPNFRMDVFIRMSSLGWMYSCP